MKNTKKVFIQLFPIEFINIIFYLINFVEPFFRTISDLYLEYHP